jgi:hypothetical protein
VPEVNRERAKKRLSLANRTTVGNAIRATTYGARSFDAATASTMRWVNSR